MNGHLDGWVNGLVDELSDFSIKNISGCANHCEWKDGWVDGYLDGWVNEWIFIWIDVWMNE